MTEVQFRKLRVGDLVTWAPAQTMGIVEWVRPHRNQVSIGFRFEEINDGNINMFSIQSDDPSLFRFLERSERESIDRPLTEGEQS